MLENIYVWIFDDIICSWILKKTDFFKETKDEYNFFRVIRNNTKNFYLNETDHFYHMSSMSHTKEKNIKVLTFSDNKWSNVQTDLIKNTGDERQLFKYFDGKNQNYYYSYKDFLEHQKNENTL